MSSAVALFALLSSVAAAPLDGDSCGYQSCPVSAPDVLNVHIVPHTHDDVGWLKTVDQYYYGGRNDIQTAGVQFILDSVVGELWKDKSRRFIYVETAFFWKWWQRQDDAIRHKVQRLVREGRLEFIGGAWSMNDEADTHYQSIIDQFTWGLRKLNDTFGECGRPRIGWQIDPFGHSREFAALLANMGYDGLFHGRIDYQDKEARLKNKTMEMLWRGNDDLGASSDLFTGVLFNTYSPPRGFCFDIFCTDAPIVDDPESPMFNVDSKIDQFMEVTRNMSHAYGTNSILVTMGDDFQYQNARTWFVNLDLLIRYANEKAAQHNKKIKLFYSTPSCYLKAVHDAKPKLPTKQDDFMPYASDANAYWTGYYTSRPTLKYFERRGNALLQVFKQLQVLADLEDHNHFLIDALRNTMGVMQHHDAVTGTEKQHVADDYARMLDAAVADGLVVAQEGLSKLTERDPSRVRRLQYARCEFNVSQCAATETSKQFIVTVYNPLAWNVSSAVRVPVVYINYNVYNDEGEVVTSQLMDLPPALVGVPTRHSQASQELVFVADEVPALGYRSYYVRRAVGEGGRGKRSVENSSNEQNTIAMNAISSYISNNIKKNGLTGENDGRVYYKSPYEEDFTADLNAEVSELQQTSAEKEDGFSMKDLNRAELRAIMDKNEESLKAFKRKNRHDKPDDTESADLATMTSGDKEDVNYVPLSSLHETMQPDAPQTVDVYSDEQFIENEHMKLGVDQATGEFTTLSLADGTSVSFHIGLLYYKGWIGDNDVDVHRASGAYIFRPNGTRAIAMPIRNNTRIIKGPIVQEIHQEYSEFASTVTRLYKHSRDLEVEWLVGPIPVEDGIPKEVIMRYQTNLSNGKTFYTDSNGRQSLKRILNKRPQYNATIKEEIAGNYYPVNSKIHIEDPGEKLRFSVMNDRAQGATSLADGQIELMVHRRLLKDDGFGVGEALNETAEGFGLVARGKHYISVGKIDSNTKQSEKIKAVEVLRPLEVLVANATITLDDWRWLKNEWSGLRDEMPKGVHLLTLERWRPNTILIRLENIFEKVDLDGADDKVTVNLATLFKTLTPTSIREVSLAANQYWEDRKTFVWEKEMEFSGNFNDNYDNVKNVHIESDETAEREDSGFVVDLKASEIRTFIIEHPAQQPIPDSEHIM